MSLQEMFIDFERATLQTRRIPLGCISPNQKRTPTHEKWIITIPYVAVSGGRLATIAKNGTEVGKWHSHACP
ncbi:hypothetical protein AFLA_005710 [Aspergillus flavus NRRL3357]|nr:hypothetical protein AFLA_005710 [Aspergillus flavus NRRL3357]